jgi:hypothetical protein
MAGRSQPTVSVWHRYSERAEFEPFSWRDHTGRLRFEGQRPTSAKRFRERIWPVSWRADHRRVGAAGNAALGGRLRPVAGQGVCVKLARRCLAEHPLQRHWDRVDEADPGDARDADLTARPLASRDGQECRS